MKIAALLLSLPCALSLGACATSEVGRAEPVAPVALASLMAGDGSARGEARVMERRDGLHVRVNAKGLTPGVHAVHVHMTGVCTGPDFVSAGGHWNPTARKHGMNNPAGMHMGDMPNMTVGADGVGQMDYVIAGGALQTGAMPLLDADGAAVVIHAAPDDNVSDPAGNAGGRIACGVLSLS